MVEADPRQGYIEQDPFQQDINFELLEPLFDHNSMVKQTVSTSRYALESFHLQGKL